MEFVGQCETDRKRAGPIDVIEELWSRSLKRVEVFNVTSSLREQSKQGTGEG